MRDYSIVILKKCVDASDQSIHSLECLKINLRLAAARVGGLKSGIEEIGEEKMKKKAA
jgi:hypothetical protein